MASEDDVDSLNAEDDIFQGGKCGIIFLIDARPSMFKKDFADDENTEQTKFNIALKCCRTVLMNKIIAKQKDVVGIVLFGTDKLDAKTNTKHVTLLLELNYPSAEAVKMLDNLLNDVDSTMLQQTHGSSDNFLLADALWFCSSLLSHSGSNLEEKRILLFTDDSNPHSTHPDRAYMARKRGKDLNQINISLEVLAMGVDFTYSTFYKELVEIVNGSNEPEEIDSSSRLEELLERVNRLDFKTRRYSKIKWDIGNGVVVGVSLYTLYRQATVLSQETLSRATNEPVKRVRQTFDQATGELLLPSDIEEFLSIAGKDIVFSNEEKESIRKIAEPGITLLGFKPATAVSEGLHCGTPAFAYPEETLIKGSKFLMKGLVERCIAKEKVALCSFTPRYRALTKYVYLIPTEEKYDSAGNQLSACGFHVIPLPFEDEVREHSFEKTDTMEDNVLEVAKKIVNKLKFNFKPSNYKNPKLQQFWAHLEALALEYDVPEHLEDSTCPDLEHQAQRLDILANEFKNVTELEGPQTFTTKRPATNSAKSPKRKVQKTKNDINSAIIDAIPKKQVDMFTVMQLRDFLKEHNQKSTGLLKAELVQSVYALNFNNEPQ